MSHLGRVTKGDMQQPAPRANNVGLLRMILALLVIISHSPELIDGNRSREILTRIFGTLSLGEVGVDGFFLLSGYLIAKSFQRSPTVLGYLVKRILRIYPGYVAAFLISVLLVGPLAGAARISLGALFAQIQQMALLQRPMAAGVFPGLPYAELNGSLWTIAYEFRCYLLVLIAGVFGLLNRRWVCLVLVAAMAVLWLTKLSLGTDILSQVTGNLNLLLRFSMVFGCGVLFYLFADRVRYTRGGAIAAACVLIPAMFLPRIAELGLVTAGGYLMFWLAFHARPTIYSRFSDRTDLSYGTYLYAWPIQSLLIYYIHGISPWLVALITIPGAVALAALSWHWVERPFMRLGHNARKAAWAPARS